MIRRLFALVGIALAVACASPTGPNAAGVTADPREKDPAFRYGRNPGPSPVGAIPDALVRDKTRNQDIKVNIDYPTRPGPHPLILFSPGGGLTNRSYPGLAAQWASYGYVVIRVAHNDQTKTEEMSVNDWRDRAHDVSAVIDGLSALAEQYPELSGRIDASRIGVAGHSRGAMTALMLGGLETFPGAVSYADPRVKAVVAMSPSGPRESWGIVNGSFTTIRVPVLFMTGSRDTGSTETETPEWRQQAFDLAPPGDKWLVTMENVTHNTYTGQFSVTDPKEVVIMDPRLDPTTAQAEAERQRRDRARMQGMGQHDLFVRIRSLAMAFFDTYLKDDPKGREYLEGADSKLRLEVKKK